MPSHPHLLELSLPCDGGSGTKRVAGGDRFLTSGVGARGDLAGLRLGRLPMASLVVTGLSASGAAQLKKEV